MSKRKLKEVLRVTGILTVTFAALLLIFTILMPFSDTNASMQAYKRCTARGYEESEAIVHYPFFWDVDTYCYGEGREDGVKL